MGQERFSRDAWRRHEPTGSSRGLEGQPEKSTAAVVVGVEPLRRGGPNTRGVVLLVTAVFGEASCNIVAAHQRKKHNSSQRLFSVINTATVSKHRQTFDTSTSTCCGRVLQLVKMCKFQTVWFFHFNKIKIKINEEAAVRVCWKISGSEQQLWGIFRACSVTFTAFSYSLLPTCIAVAKVVLMLLLFPWQKRSNLTHLSQCKTGIVKTGDLILHSVAFLNPGFSSFDHDLFIYLFIF